MHDWIYKMTYAAIPGFSFSGYIFLISMVIGGIINRKAFSLKSVFFHK